MNTRQLITAALLAFLMAFAGCGKEDTTQDANELEPASVEELAPADESTTEPAAEAAENPVEVVEESAGSSEDSGDRILLAQANTADSSAANYKYKEGTNYTRLVPTQPTVGGADKIEVAEFFWYGCPHCYDLEPAINKWAESIPANVRFVRVPAMWNKVVRLHAQLYYTEEVLARNGALKDPAKFHKAVFDEYHQRSNRLLSVDAIQKLFERFGVSKEDFDKTWNSFEVSQKLRVAEDLARRYSITSVPAIVVNGKYRTGGAEAGGYPQLIEVINELIDREGAR
jgi:protein dithiol oxidoreductase (disulfide-forming)